MIGLAELTNAPVTISIGGLDFEARAVTLDEWGGLQRWYGLHVAHPVGKLATAIEAAERAKNPIPKHLQTWMFEAALAIPFPPRIGTRAWVEGLDETEGGIAQLLLAILGPCNEGFDLAEAESLAEVATTEELITLQSVAFTGRLPDPKSEGSESMETTTSLSPTPTETTDDPDPTTPGDGSTTPSVSDEV
jgi:hypothetical protein